MEVIVNGCSAETFPELDPTAEWIIFSWCYSG